MGCWCETCGITQLPINAGDKVRLFVLVSQDSYAFHKGGLGGGGTCYSNDRWAPLGPPIQGEYDDYGGIENIVHDDDAKLTFNRIMEGWVEPEVEHEWDKVPEAKDLTLEDVIHLIERDRAKFHPKTRSEQHLGLMMVHEEVYQAMINHNPVDAHHYCKGHYRYMPIRDMLTRELKEWYNGQLDLQKLKANSAKEEELFRLISDLSDGRFFSGYKEDGMRVFKNSFMALAKEQLSFDHERVQKVAASALDLSVFNRGMYLARKQWMPQSGKGGQNNDLDIYRAITKAAVKVMDEQDARYSEDWDGGERLPNGYYKYQVDHNLEDEKKLAEEQAKALKEGEDAKEGK